MAISQGATARPQEQIAVADLISRQFSAVTNLAAQLPTEERPTNGALCSIPVHVPPGKFGNASGLVHVQVFGECTFDDTPRSAHPESAGETDFTHVAANFVGIVEVPMAKSIGSTIKVGSWNVFQSGNPTEGEARQYGVAHKGGVDRIVSRTLQDVPSTEASSVLDLLHQLEAQLSARLETGSYLQAPFSGSLPRTGLTEAVEQQIQHLPPLLRDFVRTRTEDLGGAILVAEYGVRIANQFGRRADVVRAWATKPHEQRMLFGENLEEISLALAPLALHCALLLSKSELKANEQVVNNKLEIDKGVIGTLKSFLPSEDID